MKTLLKNVLLVLMITPLLFSCSRQVKGDEKEVKDLLIQLVQEQLKNELVRDVLSSEYGMSSTLTYKDLLAKQDEEDPYYIVHKVDSIANGINFVVEDIIVIGKDKDINMVTCSATVNMDDYRADVKYTAQLTVDNDKYYVELLNIQPQ